MRKFKKFFTFLVLTSIIMFTGCSSFGNLNHSAISYGEIIEINDKEIIFCIGDRKNVILGQEYKTYRKGLTRILPGSGGRHSIPARLKDQPIETGTIRISDYKFDHDARAVIINGTVSKDDFIIIK